MKWTLEFTRGSLKDALKLNRAGLLGKKPKNYC